SSPAWRRSAVAAAVAARAAVAAGTGTTGARPARAVGAVAARARAVRTPVGGAAGVGVVGREHRSVARMPVRPRGAILVMAGPALLAGSAAAAAAATLAGVLAARHAVAARAGPPLAAGLLAVGLLFRPAAVGVAMAAGPGVDAVGHVPGAERRRVAFRKRLLAFQPALLERFLGLLGCGLAADRQAAVRLAVAATAAVLAHVVEAAQLAALVRGAVAADVAVRPVLAAHVHGRLARLALADHRLQRQCRWRAFLELQLAAQRLDLVVRQFHRLPAQQRLRQFDRAVPDPLEPRHLAALRFPQPAHLAIAPFLDRHLEPFVGIGAADALDLVELRRAVLQRHAAAQAVDDLLGHGLLAFGRAHAADVFALDLERGMHHRVGQLAVGGEQQQAGGVDVQAADRDPARALEHGQGFEDGRAALGVLAGGDLALGLVVDEHARRVGQRAGDEHLAVDLDAVSAADAHAGLRELPVDLDQAVGDALLQRAARAQSGLGQHLVQAFFQARRAGGVVGGALQ